MPRLRVLAGPTPTTLTPISANCSTPHIISTPDFEGRVLVYIKGLNDSNSTVPENEYFSRDDRKGITWSIQVQGALMTRTGLNGGPICVVIARAARAVNIL